MGQITIYISAVFLGLLLLAWSSERFVDGASGVAEYFGISPLIIGLTIVAFSTSAPEILVSALSAFQGNNGIAIGNAVGSNIANITLVLGVSALLTPLVVDSQTLRRETPILLMGMLYALVVLLWDDRLSRVDGILLMTAMALLISFTIFSARQKALSKSDLISTQQNVLPEQKLFGGVIWQLLLGLIVLLASAQLLVWGAVRIAEAFGVSDLVIGLTIVAVGTSLPELAASISAIKKGEHGMAIGNVIGSSLFNILAVLGVVGIVGPNPFDPTVLTRDYPLMIGLVLIFYVLTRRVPQGQPYVLKRWVGACLLALFFVYQGIILFGGSAQ